MKNKKLGKRNLKRIATLSLSMMMLAGMVMPMSDNFRKDMVITQADTSYDGEFKDGGRTYKYKNDGNNISLISVTEGGDLSIPSTVNINGKVRKVIGLEDFFGSNQTFANVYVPDSVVKIGNNVFLKSTMSKLRLSSYVETIGTWFGAHSKITSVDCKSKKLSKVGDYVFFESQGAERIILGEWLVKYMTNGSVVDISSEECQNVKKIMPYCVKFSNVIKTIKFGNDSFLDKKFLDSSFYKKGIKTIENVYIGGKKIECCGKNDVVPKFIKDNYNFFSFGKFDMKFAKDKAKYILNSLDIKYYGEDAKKIKGTLSPAEEYRIASKVSDYIIKNFIYDTEKTSGPYTKVLNTNGYTLCQYDAEMYAFLLENAGVEAEVVFSGKHTAISCDEWKKYTGRKCEYEGKYYKVEYSGNHAWNVIKINGDWYHVDTTTNRTVSDKSEFLVSTAYYDSRVPLYKDLSINGYRGIHGYPNFSVYAEDDAHFFQTKAYALKNPDCKKTVGNVNGDCEINQRDIDMIQAYSLLGNNDKILLQKVYSGNYKATAVERNRINSLVNNTEFIDSNGKCIFDISVADANFDGSVDVGDVITMTVRRAHMKTLQNGEYK
ncbi:transglutaminase domain-containing protein [Eubacterium sp.]|uniref:transglutaminase domain-containing protein n=1 Tax=Eubacterium sp. TaxID=142586 RepID=UPI0025EC1471|nr:transglutaminase domain-containing protein [Eubacterium sp.]MCR5629739.1 leucine-rich repeat protein [Eubacterium sp.]